MAAVAARDRGESVHRFLDELVERKAWQDLLAVYRLADARSKHPPLKREKLGFAGRVARRRLLQAPPALAVQALSDPVPHEVAEGLAEHHPWAELGAHLTDPDLRRRVAYEYAARGVDLSSVPDLDPAVLGLPFRLERWEPEYVYRSAGPEDPRAAPTGRADGVELRELGPPEERLPEDRVVRALVDLPERWARESYGEVDGVHVRGTAASAFNALGYKRGGLEPTAPRQALHALALASATGGAYGGGDGVVCARLKVWRLLAALASYVGPLPYPSEELGRASESARWFRFDTGTAPNDEWIWELYIGVELPGAGEAWALAACDRD